LSLFDEETPDPENAGAIDELFTAALSYGSSAEYLELLKFISRLSHYSPFNGLLTHIQNPKATFVATPRKWARQFQRFVRRGARPLVILAPMRPVLFVYDVEDTNGKPVPPHLLNPFRTTGDLPQETWDISTQNARQMGIGIGLDDQLSRLEAGGAFRLPEPGYFRFSDTGGKRLGPIYFVIELNEDLPLNSRYATLVHELGHILSGHLGENPVSGTRDRASLDRKIMEMEAESIAYLVCKRRGIATTSEKYLVDYVHSYTTLPEISIDHVLKAANANENMGKRRIKHVIRANKASEGEQVYPGQQSV